MTPKILIRFGKKTLRPKPSQFVTYFLVSNRSVGLESKKQFGIWKVFYQIIASNQQFQLMCKLYVLINKWLQEFCQTLFERSVIFSESSRITRHIDFRMSELEGHASNLQLTNVLFLTFSSHFFANYMNVFHKTKVQRVRRYRRVLHLKMTVWTSFLWKIYM